MIRTRAFAPSLLGISVAVVLALGTTTSVAADTGPWTIVPTPHPLSQHGGNSEVWDATSFANDSWGVGYFDGNGVQQPLAIHRVNGHWQMEPTPNPKHSVSTVLFGVAVQSRTNVWAVGSLYKQGRSRLLTLRWNGSAWSRVPISTPDGSNAGLLGVSATSPSNAWAVGRYEVNHVARTLIEHWNGTSWTQVPSPSGGGPGHSTYLWGVTALSSTDAWAVGNYFDDGYRTLTLHWNGVKWTQVASPSPGQHQFSKRFGMQVRRVFAISATDIWAVGYYMDGQNREQTLTLHWNGAHWAWIASPNVGGATHDNELAGVGGLSNGQVWAAGSYRENNVHHALLLRWSGSQWVIAGTPSPGASTNRQYLYGIAAVGPNDVTALGSYTNNGPLVTLGCIAAEATSGLNRQLFHLGTRDLSCGSLSRSANQANDSRGTPSQRSSSGDCCGNGASKRSVASSRKRNASARWSRSEAASVGAPRTPPTSHLTIDSGISSRWT